jgi:hypothetical protein
MGHSFQGSVIAPGPRRHRSFKHALGAVFAPLARLRGYQGRNEEYLTRGPSEIVDLEPLPEGIQAMMASPAPDS